MPRDLILGTAGHIDHGKTSLVRALTGVDTDRLPEEKARGITIDIGFAQLDLGEFHLGIVDVPGHERFVKNMLAGATGIDLVVLIVAADDSVMPQTREHLDILRLLGVKHGVIALTKADLVDDVTREVAELEVRELVEDSFLADAPIIPTSAITGAGIPELQAAILEQAKKINQREAQEWFRLPIDRSFVIQGHGTVVTGSIVAGAVKVGDELDWHLGDGQMEKIRVRSLNNHGKSVEELHRGQRGAINLAGIAHERVRRGQELATPGYLRPSKVITVRVLALGNSRRGIKHRLPCRLHVGTSEVLASVLVLDQDQIPPGEWALCQLFLEEPVTVVWGQPFVLRDSSAEHTIGGGQVLQPTATKIRRRHVEQLEWAEKLWTEDLPQRVTAAAWFHNFSGFQADDLVRDAGVPLSQIEPLLAQLQKESVLVELLLPPNRKLLLHASRVSELGERILSTLAILHEQNPLMTNHDRQKVLSRLDYVGDESLLQAITDHLIRQKQLVEGNRRIARSDFKPKLSTNQRKLKDKIVEDHRLAGFQPPEPSSYSNQVSGNATATLRDIFEVAIAEGFLYRVTDTIHLHSDHHELMMTKLREKFGDGTGGTVADIRDILGTSRKYAIPICEYLDRIGLTRRDGDYRYLATPAEASETPSERKISTM